MMYCMVEVQWYSDMEFELAEYIIRGASREDILRKAQERWPMAVCIEVGKEVKVLE